MKAVLIAILSLLPLVVAAQQEENPNYVYDPKDRPDPFVPYKPKVNQVPPGQVSVDGAKLVGITDQKGTRIVILKGPDNKTHFLKEGDRIFDGVIEKINSDSVVFRQFLSEDSILREKEVVKYLYPEQSNQENKN
ncbi:MAG TPA: hypothetical protein VLH08_20115 [Acidobacteriota bacterium]|nr:hypothetical protein [Acidobacteriota bacterium]